MANANMNSDGIEQCITVMKSALAAGDSEKATKFMEKAKKLGADGARLQTIIRNYSA